MGRSENVLIHLGQAGCQAGVACWELFCLEHGIMPDGTLATEFGHSRREEETGPFFVEVAPCRYVPRALFFDFDPDVIDAIKSGGHRELYNHGQLLSGKEDTSNNFARGFCSMGREFIDCFIDRLRRITECMDFLTGFLFMRSICGGTGGGFGSLLIRKLDELYPKLTKVVWDHCPSPRLSTAAVEPYNAILSFHNCIDYAHVNFLYENECLYTIYRRQLDVKHPNYASINQLIAQATSAITSSFRFDGPNVSDVTQLQTNLTPYPRLHFPMMCYGPLVDWDKACHEVCSVRCLTNLVLNPNNMLLHCNPRKGKYIAASVMYRGDVSPNDVNEVVQSYKGHGPNNPLKFVDWSPGGFKVAICYQGPIAIPGSHLGCGCRAAVGLFNNTAVSDVWRLLGAKHDMLWQRRAFVHWYLGEGMEEDDFVDARTNIETLIKDYDEIAEPSLGKCVRRSNLTVSSGLSAGLPTEEDLEAGADEFPKKLSNGSRKGSSASGKRDSVGSKKGSLSKQESISSKKESLSTKRESLASKGESMGGKRESISSKVEADSSNRGSIGSKRESIGTKREDNGSKRESTGSKKESLGGRKTIGAANDEVEE